MITQIEGGNIIFECDHCGDPLDTKTRDPEKAVDIFNGEGWRVVKFPHAATEAMPDEHYCDTCPIKKAIIR